MGAGAGVGRVRTLSSSTGGEHKYSKEQILAAYSASLPVPEVLIRMSDVFRPEATTPVSQQALSDAEKVRPYARRVPAAALAARPAP